LFHQVRPLLGISPGVQVGLGKAAPPYFVSKTYHPISMLAGQLDHFISALFLRWYSGSGLVIQCFARFHFTPGR
jgi:hypothetical protein